MWQTSEWRRNFWWQELLSSPPNVFRTLSPSRPQREREVCSHWAVFGPVTRHTSPPWAEYSSWSRCSVSRHSSPRLILSEGHHIFGCFYPSSSPVECEAPDMCICVCIPGTNVLTSQAGSLRGPGRAGAQEDCLRSPGSQAHDAGRGMSVRDL